MPYLKACVMEAVRLSYGLSARNPRTRRTQPLQYKHWTIPPNTNISMTIPKVSHDEAIFPNSHEFIPERFYEWDGSPYNFIPQGGGEHYGGHRCAGEWITISLLETAVSFLARSLRYTVPPQPLRVSLSRMPAEPRSRFVIRDVRLN